MYTKPTHFRYFIYRTDNARYVWVLDDVHQIMHQSSVGLAANNASSSMKDYSYAEFVSGNFIIAWEELDREEYLGCIVS